MLDHGRADAFMREAHVAVRAAAAHLRPVGRQPTYLAPFAHTHFRQDLPQQKHTLAAEACDLHGEVRLRVLYGHRTRHYFLRLVQTKKLRHASLRHSVCHWRKLAIAEDTQREDREHFFFDPLSRFLRRHFPDRRAR